MASIRNQGCGCALLVILFTILEIVGLVVKDLLGDAIERAGLGWLEASIVIAILIGVVAAVFFGIPETIENWIFPNKANTCSQTSSSLFQHPYENWRFVLAVWGIPLLLLLLLSFCCGKLWGPVPS
jgi:hypothetical protein